MAKNAAMCAAKYSTEAVVPAFVAFAAISNIHRSLIRHPT
jgi:hypothetical protein